MRISDWSSDVCSSDLLKTQVIIPELRRRFAGLPIVNVTGVRAEESATRARLAIADKDKKSTPSQPLWNWRPILHWKLHDVLDTISRAGQPLHRAYTEFGTTRAIGRASCRERVCKYV